MNQFARMDRALDEVLVQLGGMVLRLSSPEVTRTAEERHALKRSVNQYAVCAAHSDDPRVNHLPLAQRIPNQWQCAKHNAVRCEIERPMRCALSRNTLAGA